MRARGQTAERSRDAWTVAPLEYATLAWMALEFASDWSVSRAQAVFPLGNEHSEHVVCVDEWSLMTPDGGGTVTRAGYPEGCRRSGPTRPHIAPGWQGLAANPGRCGADCAKYLDTSVKRHRL